MTINRILVSTPLLLIIIVCTNNGCAPNPVQTNSGTQTTTQPAVETEESTSKIEIIKPVEDSAASTAAAEMKPETSTTTAESSVNTEVKESVPESDVPLELASWEQVQQKIAEQKGKIVVLDIWSSWCLPCVREFPGLVAMQKKYPDQIVCISLNLNYDGRESHPPESYRTEVQEFLQRKQAWIINLISTTPDEKVYETIDLASIPVAFVYRQDGSLAKRFDNETNAYGEEGFTYKDHIEPFIAGLLAEKTE